jgi:hypothetical protein
MGFGFRFKPFAKIPSKNNIINSSATTLPLKFDLELSIEVERKCSPPPPPPPPPRKENTKHSRSKKQKNGIRIRHRFHAERLFSESDTDESAEGRKAQTLSYALKACNKIKARTDVVVGERGRREEEEWEKKRAG